jgi:hypothetical protein
MAGYLGTKTVLLSTTAANVTGDATISGDLTVDTDTLYVDSTNNRVGIGTDSPSALLTTEVTGSLTLDSNDSDYSAFGLLVHQPSSRATNTVNAAIGFASEGGRKYAAIGAQTYGDLDQTGLNFYVQSNNSGSSANLEEAMRIDSSGNLLVGKTATDSATVGCEQSPFGYQYLTRSSGAAQFIRRNSTDGEAVRFYKDSANVGSIGVTAGDLAIGTGDTGLRFNDGGNSIIPHNMTTNSPVDNVLDIGQAAYRWDDIYATNGTIQTSDRNEKQDIASLTPTEMLVAARLSTGFKNFRWKDSVAEKGTAARMHSGAIAQDVQDAFTAEGLEAGDYSMFISATWWTHDVDVPAVEAVAEAVDEEGVVVTEAVEAVAAYTRTDTYDTEAEAPVGAVSKTRLGVRYPELLSFVAAYNEQRFASIEARLTALEAV